MYIEARAPSIHRPPKELKGFKKVFLEAGASSEVRVEMDKKYALSFWDESRDEWIVEKGQYVIMVGTSSRGRFLEETFEEGQTWWWTGL